MPPYVRHGIKLALPVHFTDAAQELEMLAAS